MSAAARKIAAQVASTKALTQAERRAARRAAVKAADQAALQTPLSQAVAKKATTLSTSDRQAKRRAARAAKKVAIELDELQPLLYRGGPFRITQVIVNRKTGAILGSKTTGEPLFFNSRKKAFAAIEALKAQAAKK